MIILNDSNVGCTTSECGIILSAPAQNRKQAVSIANEILETSID